MISLVSTFWVNQGFGVSFFRSPSFFICIFFLHQFHLFLLVVYSNKRQCWLLKLIEGRKSDQSVGIVYSRERLGEEKEGNSKTWVYPRFLILKIFLLRETFLSVDSINFLVNWLNQRSKDFDFPMDEQLEKKDYLKFFKSNFPFFFSSKMDLKSQFLCFYLVMVQAKLIFTWRKV